MIFAYDRAGNIDLLLSNTNLMVAPPGGAILVSEK